MPLRVTNVVGARPNFIKIALTMKQMAKWAEEFQPRFVHTGKHYDAKMSVAFSAEAWSEKMCPGEESYEEAEARRIWNGAPHQVHAATNFNRLPLDAADLWIAS